MTYQNKSKKTNKQKNKNKKQTNNNNKQTKQNNQPVMGTALLLEEYEVHNVDKS